MNEILNSIVSAYSEILAASSKALPGITDGLKGKSSYKAIQDTVIDSMSEGGNAPRRGRKASRLEAEQDIYGAQARQEAVQRTDSPNDENADGDAVVSICQSAQEGEAKPVAAGILEGFGLLTEKADGTAIIDEGVVAIEADEADIPKEAAVKNGEAFIDALKRHIGSLENTNQTLNTVTETDGHQPAAQPAVQAVSPAVPGADEAAQEYDAEAEVPISAQQAPVAAQLSKQSGEPAESGIGGGEKAEEGTEIKRDDIQSTSGESAFAQAAREARIESRSPARVEAPQPVAVPVNDADMAENITGIIKGVTSAIQDGNREFTVSLKPEFLGELSIKLTLEAGGIRAQIKASDYAARGLIQAELPSLQEQLRERGLIVSRVDVSYEAASSDLQGGHHSGGFAGWRGEGEGNFRPVYVPDMEATVRTEAAFAAFEGANFGGYGEDGYMPEGSSVKFTA